VIKEVSMPGLSAEEQQASADKHLSTLNMMHR
jgi:hypothetical protein